jgi:prepilin-type N-terminal cleavage/methylation domain-containing protein
MREFSYIIVLMVSGGRQKGFTVVEILIAIGLFGVIMPGIILAVMALNIMNDRAGDLSYANTIAEGKIEALRSAGYNSLTTGSTTTFTSELPASFDDPRSATYSVTAGPVTGTKVVDITLSYNSYGKTISLSYKALFSELGIAQ